MVTRYLSNTVAGFLLGALTSRLYGKHLAEFAADSARRIGTAVRNVTNAFNEGLSGKCAKAEDEGTPVEVDEED